MLFKSSALKATFSSVETTARTIDKSLQYVENAVDKALAVQKATHDIEVAMAVAEAKADLEQQASKLVSDGGTEAIDKLMEKYKS